MKKFSLLITLGLVTAFLSSCDTGDYYEIYEDDTIEAVDSNSKDFNAEFSKYSYEEINSDTEYTFEETLSDKEKEEKELLRSESK